MGGCCCLATTIICTLLLLGGTTWWWCQKVKHRAYRPIQVTEFQTVDMGMAVEIKGCHYREFNDIFVEPSLLEDITELNELDYPEALYSEEQWEKKGGQRWLANSTMTSFLLFFDTSDLDKPFQMGWT